jgi:16S rRNA (cytidine1402-2'-O)-methyltransferase
MAGTLSIVGTPIGNLDDLSPRALKVLAGADLIACEDTRVSRKLATMAGARAPLMRYDTVAERRQTDELVRRIASGEHVALVTDAGMPGVSDPGQRLVAACREAGLHVEVIPGPSAALAALVASGLPCARFVFEGFLPRTGAARRKRLHALASEPRTIVVFEGPHRLAESLADMVRAFGASRRVALARELTKVHEEVAVTTLGELRERVVASGGVRGEVTLVIEGASEPEDAALSPDDLAEQVRARMAEGIPKKDAIAAVAAETRTPKKVVYQAAIDAGL